MTATDAPDRRVRRAAVALLCVVAVGALVLSFAGLALLGALAGFGRLAPVFAVVVDAGTGAATLYWLTGAAPSPRARYARRLGLTLLAVSLVGNGAAHGLAAGGVPVDGLAAGLVLAMPWWAAAVVGAIPPAVFAGVVHLLAMGDDHPGGRPPGRLLGDPGGLVVSDVGDGSETAGAGPVDWWATAPPATPSTVAEYAAARAHNRPAAPATGPALPLPGGRPGDDGDEVGDQAGDSANSSGDTPDPERLAALVAAGAGRRRVARELDITEHRARELLGGRRLRRTP